MKPREFTELFETVIESAMHLARVAQADALLLLIERPVDWPRLKELLQGEKLVVAASSQELLAGAEDVEIPAVLVSMSDVPVYEKLAQALLEGVADDVLAPGCRVISLYSGFEAGTIDSISMLDMGEHLRRLTVRDLRKLESRVPLETLQTVVNLALEIGREGREGKPVGTLFVVGDTRKVLASSYPTGFDPVKGYSRKERNIQNAKVREGIKEIAQMDGGIVIASDGTVEAAARYLDAPAAGITMTKGLGARHWAAASISRATKAIAVTVSESSGTVRLFQNGEVILRVEPFRRPMKWKDFDRESPVASE